MILTGITDEITGSFEDSIEIGTRKGIKHYEIRKINEFRFPFFPDCYYDILAHFKKEYELTYTAVSPGIFKNPFKLARDFGFKDQLWDQIIKSAIKLGAKRIIIFSYEKCDTESEYGQMIDDIGLFCHKTSLEGLDVSLENSPSTWCVTGSDQLKIITNVGASNLNANWDPANAGIRGHLDYNEGYGVIKDYIDNVHIKDVMACSKESGKYCYAACGQGLLDIRGQIESLKKDGYKGSVVLETHCEPLFENFSKSYEFINLLLAKI